VRVPARASICTSVLVSQRAAATDATVAHHQTPSSEKEASLSAGRFYEATAFDDFSIDFRRSRRLNRTPTDVKLGLMALCA